MQGIVKAAAAEVNKELGLVSNDFTDAIVTATREVADGQWDQEFILSFCWKHVIVPRFRVKNLEKRGDEVDHRHGVLQRCSPSIFGRRTRLAVGLSRTRHALGDVEGNSNSFCVIR